MWITSTGITIDSGVARLINNIPDSKQSSEISSNTSIASHRTNYSAYLCRRHSCTGFLDFYILKDNVPVQNNILAKMPAPVANHNCSTTNLN